MINPHHPNNIIILRKTYHKLKRAQALLTALEHGGVDNWDWHSEAYREYLKSIKGKPWDEGHADDLEDEEG